MDAAITPRDRLSFALFLAISLHAAVILGVGFVWTVERAHSPTIEVTLAQHDDKDAPDQADFIAQHNQVGSGDAMAVQETTTTEEAAFHDNVLRSVQDDPFLPQEERQTADPLAAVTTRSARPQKASNETFAENADATPVPERHRELNLTPDIASIEARIDAEAHLDAKGPRVRRLTSVSARSAVDAYYLQAWRRKVETIGNLNYPDEARRKSLYGSLRLLVAITPDGGLKEVRVLDSSGHKVLDDAAIRIVRLAAPYAPFPPEMRADTDVLEIIRTWQFRKNHYSSSS
jgi:protein TonB